MKLKPLTAVSFLATPLVSSAYDLPPVNLGLTSFLDAAPPAGSGWYFTEYVQHYKADKFKDKDGNNLALPDPDLDVTVSLSQLTYITEKLLWGANIGFGVTLPYVKPELTYSASGTFPEAAGSGFGDLFVGSLLQWPPVMGEYGPKFFQRIELQFILPTGSYDSDKEINPGSNFWSFNPYWTGTYFFTPKMTGSLRTHYLWNSKNKDPNRAFGAANDTQAGQAVHTNFALEYAFTTKFRAGLNSYYLKQVTDTKVDGNRVSGRREQVLGLGLGGLYSFSKESHIFFNFFDESNVENRTEGQRYIIRFVYHF
jgi:anthranilate 1,2-dioxygenase (deaminating, decarboxylating) large subunit